MHFLFIPWFSGIAELPALLLIVLGVTLLEMFYGAGIDTLITLADSPRKLQYSMVSPVFHWQLVRQ